MAERKKQVKRKKPSAKRKPKAPSEEEARPHKLIGHLVTLKFNAAGKLTAHQTLETILFRPDFKRAAKVLQERATEVAGEGFVASIFDAQLWGAHVNEHGEVADEGPMGPLPLVESEFGKVSQIIEKKVQEAREAETAAREAQAP